MIHSHSYLCVVKSFVTHCNESQKPWRNRHNKVLVHRCFDLRSSIVLRGCVFVINLEGITLSMVAIQYWILILVSGTYI